MLHAWQELLPGLQAELKLLGAMKRSSGDAKSDDDCLYPWDIGYLMNKKRAESAHEVNLLSPYLSYEALMRGANEILKNMFGLLVDERPHILKKG